DLDLADMPEPMLPMGLTPIAEPEPQPAPTDDWVEPISAPSGEPGALTSLFDRLAGDADLYASLTQADEVFVAPRAAADAPAEIETAAEPAPEEADVTEPVPDMIAAVIAFADDPEADPATNAPAADSPAPEPEPAPVPVTTSPSQWLITGRG